MPTLRNIYLFAAHDSNGCMYGIYVLLETAFPSWSMSTLYLYLYVWYGKNDEVNHQKEVNFLKGAHIYEPMRHLYVNRKRHVARVGIWKVLSLFLSCFSLEYNIGMRHLVSVFLRISFFTEKRMRRTQRKFLPETPPQLLSAVFRFIFRKQFSYIFPFWKTKPI